MANSKLFSLEIFCRLETLGVGPNDIGRIQYNTIQYNTIQYEFIVKIQLAPNNDVLSQTEPKVGVCESTPANLQVFHKHNKIKT